MSDETAKPDFIWVDCYCSIANALRKNKNNQEKLLSIFKEISGTKEPFGQIDPFSFIAAFNRHQKWENKTKIIHQVCSALSIEAAIPEDFSGIPVVNNQRSWFWSGKDLDFEYCWQLFDLALDYVDHKETTSETDFCKAFDNALSIKYVGLAKLTMALYWIRPEAYIPLDANTVSFLKKHFDNAFSASEITGSGYLSLLEKINQYFDKPFYELSAIAYDEAKADDDWWPSRLNTILCGPPGTSKTYKTMAYAVAICDHGDPEELYRRMSYDGYEEVAARYKQLKAEERIDFVTFHQSYGYEEFIEGIRPVLSSDQNTDESGQIQYDRIDGAFKSFCEKASDTTEILAAASDIPVFEENANPTVWKIGLKLDSVPDLFKKCHADRVIRLGWDQVPFGEYEADESITASNRACIQAFEEEMQPGDLFVVPGSDPKLVSVGVVVGDCEWNEGYPAAKRVRKVKWLGDFSKKEFKHLNGDKQLTLKTIYKLDRVNVVELLSAMGKVSTTPIVKATSEEKPYVFIIDEINRGNISRIFGELITLLEDSKRLGAKEEMRVRLPYSGKNFGVPSNVYVLGTMNTADRSIALMDTALRRRFDFKEMMPDYDLLKDVDVDGVDVAKMLEKMNERIEYLYDREHTIGHAYLIPLRDNPRIEALSEIFRNRIVPLLQEYFYDDYAKIRAVFGLAADEFIERKDCDANLFPGDENVRPAKVIYLVNDIPADPSAYKKIYQDEDGQ